MFSMECKWILLVTMLNAQVSFFTCQPVGVLESNKNSLAPFLNKKYELAHSDDKFDAIMKALGVGVIKRNLAKLAKPVIELKEKDGEYILTSDSTFRNLITKFKIGEEFEEETPDGRKVKSMFIQDKNKLTQIQDGDKITTIVREFQPDEVKITVQVDDIVSVRTYKRV